MSEAIVLAPEQEKAIEMTVEAIEDEQDFKLGGYAGTGKTSVAKEIISEIDKWCMPCAFTGKAAMRLVQKGVPATTIHSLIYNYDPQIKGFKLKSEVEGDWFLIDESSMISTELLQDLRTFDLPILFLGDPGQLEPVGENPYIMRDCDFVLQHIHRQGEGSGIVTFGADIRLHKFSKLNKYDNVDISIGVKPTDDQLMENDIVLCGTNSTRRKLNTRIRKLKDYDGTLAQGENIIITRNHRQTGLRNGQILTVTNVGEVKKKNQHFEAKDQVLGKTYDIKVRTEIFGAVKLTQTGYHEILADYAQTITVHKSQGSQWDCVMVIDEQCPYWSPVKWRYTAITRAAKNVAYFF